MIKETILFNEGAKLIKEILSVSIDVRNIANEIIETVENDVKFINSSNDYQYIRGECIYNGNLNVKYLVINCKSKKIYQTLLKTLKNIPDNYFDYEKEEIFIVLWAINQKILQNAINIENTIHETEYYYQYISQNKFKDIVSDRQLYEFAKNESQSDNIIRKKIGTLIYLTEKSEMDAIIQQMQANFTDYLDILTVYPNTMAYKAYHYCKKNIKVIDSDEAKDTIVKYYTKYGINYDRINKRISYGIKYYENKIGKVLSYYKKGENIRKMIS